MHRPVQRTAVQLRQVLTSSGPSMPWVGLLRLWFRVALPFPFGAPRLTWTPNLIRHARAVDSEIWNRMASVRSGNVAYSGNSAGMSSATVGRLLPAEQRVDGAVQRVRDRGQLFGVRVSSGILPGFDRRTRDAGAATELGLAESFALTVFSDFFRALASLTFFVSRVTLISLTVDARKRRSPLMWF